MLKRYLQQIFFSLAYLKNPPWDTGITPPELYEFIADHPPGNALDLGCGTGTNAITLANHNWHVMGIDFAWPAILIARRKARRLSIPIEFIVGDVSRDAPLDRSFDLILDIGCLHNLSFQSKRRYIQRLPQLLGPGGIFLLYGFIRPAGVSGTGLTEEDLFQISSYLALKKREDGTDRGKRQSAWFTFQLQSEGVHTAPKSRD